MSETTQQAETPAEFLEGVAATAPSQTAEVVDAPADPEQTEQPAPRPDKVERRIANLTRKMAEEARLREAVERELAATRELLNADKEKPTHAPDIEARAAALVSEREFNRRLSEIDSAGKKDMGADQWEQAKATLTGLGAINNQAFLQALAEAENPAKLFAHLADDTDALIDLLGRSPAAMAARIGRLDAQMGRPVTRPLSSAPPPAPKVKPSGTAPEPDPHNYPSNMSMREWSKMMDQHLPPHLGGKKKAS